MHSMIVLLGALAIGVSAPTPSAGQGKPARPAAEEQKGGRGKAVAARAERGDASAQAQQQGQGKPRGEARGRGQGQGKPDAQARGQGQGRPDRAEARGRRGQGSPGRPAQARGQGRDADRGGPAHARGRRGGPPPDEATFNRGLAERAVRTRGHRKADAPRVELRREGGELRIVRADDGRILFAMNQDRAGNIGFWRVATVRAADRRDRDGVILGDDDRGGAPSFCRSGAGHPVWGREWCVDKGFGLGADAGLWGMTDRVGDIVLRRPRREADILDRGGLIDVLGDIVLGRIALQALVLGADEPLTGVWLGEPSGARILRVRAGPIEVAEFVDRDRDDSIDVLLVNIGD